MELDDPGFHHSVLADFRDRLRLRAGPVSRKPGWCASTTSRPDQCLLGLAARACPFDVASRLLTCSRAQGPCERMTTVLASGSLVNLYWLCTPFGRSVASRPKSGRSRCRQPLSRRRYRWFLSRRQQMSAQPRVRKASWMSSHGSPGGSAGGGTSAGGRTRAARPSIGRPGRSRARCRGGRSAASRRDSIPDGGACRGRSRGRPAPHSVGVGVGVGAGAALATRGRHNVGDRVVLAAGSGQAAPAGHARTEAELLPKVFPGDAGVQNEQDALGVAAPCQHAAVRVATAGRTAPEEYGLVPRVARCHPRSGNRTAQEVPEACPEPHPHP